MKNATFKFISSFFYLSVSLSQWSSDSSISQSFGSGIQAQAVSTSDGGLYIAWLSDGNYHVYLQYLNNLGEPQLGDGGLVISDNQNASWIAVYHLNLAVDQEGNAIITTLDQRAGSVWEVYTYKVGSNGTMYWGIDGLALTSSGVSNMSPRLAISDDNSVIVTWTHNDNTVLFQHISSNGTLLWGDGILIADDNATIISPKPVTTTDSNILIQWIRQTGPFWAANSELYLQKYDYDGNALWSEPVIAAGPVVFPMGNWSQQLLPDASSGNFSAWTEMSGNVQNARVQHMDTDGNLQWDGGVNFSDNSSHFRTSPKLAIAESNQNLIAVWNESNGSQSQRGVYAQMVDNDGIKLWGSNGSAVIDLNDGYDYLDLSVHSFGDDMISIYIEQAVNMNGDIYATKLDQDGNHVWMNSRIAITSSGNSKTDLTTASGPNCVFIVWTENGSVYGHCLRSDGTFGPPDVTPPPLISDQQINEDEELNIDLSDIGETMTYQAYSDTAAVSVIIDGQSLLLTPIPNWHGISNITVYMTDENSLSDTTSFVLTVSSVNDPPSIESVDDITIPEDGIGYVYLNAIDIDTDELIYNFYSNQPLFSFELIEDTLFISPVLNWSGYSNLIIYVSDGENSVSTSFGITVTPVNDPPSEFELISPTVLDTFQISSLTEDTIPFVWRSSFDVDSDLTYKLTVTLENSGDVYTQDYLNISDSSISISTYEYATFMTDRSLTLCNTVYVVEVSDEEFTVISHEGEFVLTNTLLSIDSDIIPDVFTLHQNYPNPFNPITLLSYDLPKDEFVNITIYDILGKMVKTLVNSSQTGGYKSIVWNATNNKSESVAAGLYLYMIQAGEFKQTKKMLLLK